MEPAIPHRPCQCCKGVGGWMVAEYESGGACVGQHFDECANCKSTGTAPMSRREEVDAKLLHTALSDWPSADEAAEYRHLSLTLADEVDALTAENAELRASMACLQFKLKAKQSPDEHLFTEPRDAELAAANATLDALREAIPNDGSSSWCNKCGMCVDLEHVQDYEDTWIKCERCGSWDYAENLEIDVIRAILYPQPAAMAEEKTNGPE